MLWNAKTRTGQKVQIFGAGSYHLFFIYVSLYCDSVRGYRIQKDFHFFWPELTAEHKEWRTAGAQTHE